MVNYSPEELCQIEESAANTATPEPMDPSHSEKPDIINRHIELIQAGDTILCTDGVARTICGKDIRREGFMGTTLRGDSYCLGGKPVQLIRMGAPRK